MMPPAPSAAEFPTVFDWTAPRSRKLSLLSFVAASAALHALCFYVFQIIYPPTAAAPLPPARVNLITPQSEEGRALLRWLEAEDPALSSTTQRPPSNSAFVPPKPAYVPSYANRQPALREPPPFQPDLRVPSSRPPAPVARPGTSMPATAPPVPTSVRFFAETETGAPVLPSLQFTASNNEPPQAAQFRIAVGARGEVRYCFLQESSGDSILDDQARRYLLLTRFPILENRESKKEKGDLWMTAIIEWGNDLAVPSANKTEPSAP